MIIYFFICASIAAITITTIAYVIYEITEYYGCYENRIKIKYDSFVKFYNVNPKAWCLKYNYVTYIASRCSSYRFGYFMENKNFEFYFSFIDYIRYKIWKKQNEKLKQEKKNAEDYLTALKYIEADIKYFTEQNNNFIEEEMKKITKCM